MSNAHLNPLFAGLLDGIMATSGGNNAMRRNRTLNELRSAYLHNELTRAEYEQERDLIYEAEDEAREEQGERERDEKGRDER